MTEQQDTTETVVKLINAGRTVSDEKMWEGADLKTVLMRVCDNERPLVWKSMKEILDRGAPIDFVDGTRTPLLAILCNLYQASSKNNHAPFNQKVDCVFDGAPSIMKRLVKGTENHINHADNEGKTALYYALELWTKMKDGSREKCTEIIQLLIQHGADVADEKVQGLLNRNTKLKTLVEGAVNAAQPVEQKLPPNPNGAVPLDGETTNVENLKSELKGLYKKYVAGTISAAELERMKNLEGEFVSIVGDKGESMCSLLAEAGQELVKTECQKLSTQVEQAKNAAYQQGFEAGKKQSGGGGSGPEPGKEKELKEKENLPPEAVVQQPEKESFWNWKNILWLLGIAATFGLSLWFVKREKDKVKDAKKETATLQKEVNSLQNQLDDLTKDAATLTPVDTHDGATLASSAIRYTDSIVNVSSRADKSNC